MTEKYFEGDGVALYCGDWLAVLRGLPSASVNCVVTSPPYYGLRDYGVDGQIGLEETPTAYVAKLVAGFAEVWRVLRDDGVVFLNLGDSYAGSGVNSPPSKKSGLNGGRGCASSEKVMNGLGRAPTTPGLKPKDLIGIPWRVAFALQDAGWYLRSDIIWAKPNPMPESVTDRPTKSHEYVFLLSKAERYWYDAEAIKDAGSPNTLPRLLRGVSNNHKNINGAPGQTPHSLSKPRDRGVGYNDLDGATRNARTVWTIATHPYGGAHFATMPPELARRCVVAGCPAGGVVLDPFNGAGTTGLVALQNERKYIGIDINREYLAMTSERISSVLCQPRLFSVARAETVVDQSVDIQTKIA